MKNLREIPLKEVAEHASSNDCWIVICDHVYDITNFLPQHPGGDFIILEEAGQDVSFSFLDAGHDLSSSTLKDFLIGILPPTERLSNNYKLHQH